MRTNLMAKERGCTKQLHTTRAVTKGKRWLVGPTCKSLQLHGWGCLLCLTGRLYIYWVSLYLVCYMFVPWCFGQCDHYPKLSKYLLSFWVHTSRCVHHNSLTVRLYVVCKSKHHNSNCDAQLEQQPINSTLHTQSTVWGNGLQPSQSGAGCRPSPASSRSKEPFNNAVQDSVALILENAGSTIYDI